LQETTPRHVNPSSKKWDIDLTKSYVIGDAQSDIEAGQQAGCQGILTTELEKIVARLP